jgi:DNA-binding NarL/FixJ family response regulator
VGMAAEKASTSVLVVEDQQVLASALEIAIGTQPDLDCVGSASTVDDAVTQISARKPDVVLMDIQLPGTNGIEGTRRIKAAFPDVSILILTANVTSQRLAAAAEAGATGFLAKHGPFSDILAAIRSPKPTKMVIQPAAFDESIHVPPARVPAEVGQPAEVRQQAETSPRAKRARLTAREQEVLALMGEGLDPASIAERLVVSVYTARGHVKHIMMKLGAHTQLEAVVLATRSGLLPLVKAGKRRE